MPKRRSTTEWIKIKIDMATKFNRNLRRRETLKFWLYISPWIIGFLCFTAIPIAVSFVLSFTTARVATLLRDPLHFVGFLNYREIFTVDPMFLRSIGTTFLYSFGKVFLSIFLALLVALLLNQKFRGRNVYRALIYTPCIIPAVASGLLMQLIFFQDRSILVYVFDFLGLGRIEFGSRAWAMPTLIVSGAFWGIGGNMVLILAGLQNVPSDIMEAAELDGANGTQKLWHIILPMISPTLFFMLVTGFISGLQAYAEIELVTGRSEHTMTMAMFVIDNAFGGIGMGYACAAAWVIFAIILVFTLVFYKVTIKRVFYMGE